MPPAATAFIYTRIYGPTSRASSGKVVSGTGPNELSRSIGSIRIHSFDREVVIMNDNRTIQLVEIPIGGKGGFTWNRLHAEREEICETLARTFGPNSDVDRELLQARLRKLDDALDRLMSGSYGNCSQCGGAINQIALETDPATSLCLDCSAIKPVSASSATNATTDLVLETLSPFDTILLQTENSEYRIL